MAKRGPKPRVADDDLDLEVVKGLAFAGCSVRVMADYCGVPHATMDRIVAREPVASIVTKARASRTKALHAAQWEAAVVDRNPTMLIWLGKQELGQREVSRYELTGAEGKPVEVRNDSTGIGPDQIAEVLAGLDSVGALARTNGAAAPSEAAEPTKH